MMHDALQLLKLLGQEDLDAVVDALHWIESQEEGSAAVYLINANECRLPVEEETLHLDVRVQRFHRLRLAALRPMRPSG